MNWMQTAGCWALVAVIIVAALWMAGATGLWLWRWSGRVALRMAERECHLAELLADGRAVR